MADLTTTGEGEVDSNAISYDQTPEVKLDIPDKYVGMFSNEPTNEETDPFMDTFTNTDTGSELTVSESDIPSNLNEATSDELEANTTEVSVPTATEPSTSPSYNSSLSVEDVVNSIESYRADKAEQEEANKLADQQKELTEQREDIYEAFVELGDMSEFIEDAEEDAKLQQRREELTEITNKIRSKEHEFRRNIEAIQDLPGLSRAQKNARIADVDRRQSREIADLEIIALARQGRYNDAKAAVDRKVEIEMQARANELEGLKFLYQENKERFNTLEQRAFEKTILDEERAYQEEYDKRMQFENLKFQMVINATEAGASVGEIEGIQSATDRSQLLSVPNASRYMKSTAQILDERLKKAQIASIWDSLSDDTNTVTIDGVEYTEEDLLSAQLKADKAQEVYAQIMKMKDMKGKGGAIGFSWQKLLKYGDEPYAGTSAAGYAAEAQRLIAMLSEQNLGRLKGSMSDNDLKFIQKISTSLDVNSDEGSWDTEMARLENEARIGYQESASLLGLSPLDTDPNDVADVAANEVDALFQSGESIYQNSM